MTNSLLSVEADSDVTTAANHRITLSESRDSHVPSPARQTYVSREQYIRLLVSHRNLQRCDDAAMGLRGLRDNATGEFFFIKESDCFD